MLLELTTAEFSTRLLIQLAIILIACRLAGLAMRRFGQPQVMGEIVAGILLGPSLFGAIAPAAHDWVFPGQTMSVLYPVSQISLALYLFYIGLQFHPSLIAGRVGSALSIATAGVVVPFAFGGAAALLLFDGHDLFTHTVAPWQAALFLGISLSITAFPVLTRMLSEYGLIDTPVGMLALAAGAATDIAAWSLLALVLASISGNIGPGALTAALAAAFIAAMLTLGRRGLAVCMSRLSPRADGGAVLAGALVMMLVSAWCTDAMGLHPGFGAFLAGAIFPRNAHAERIQAAIEPLTLHLLLPLFFVYSGLNTSIGLIDTPQRWAVFAVIVVGASAGKGITCGLAARRRLTRADAFAMGVLMNTRGLMELIAANVGLQRGIITPLLFAMLVLMALVTSMLTPPLLRRFYLANRPAGNRSPR